MELKKFSTPDSIFQLPTVLISESSSEAARGRTKLKEDNLKPETATTEQVVARCVQFAKSFADFWNTNNRWVLELKKRFQVRQGSRGMQLKVEGVQMYWDEFRAKYLHATAENIRQLVKREKEESTPKPDEQKPLYKKGWKACEEKMLRELAANGHSSQKLNEPKPVLTDAEKKEIAILATETSVSRHAVVAKEIYEALTQDNGMNSVELSLVVSELQKLNKPSNHPMHTRFDNTAVKQAAA